MDNKRAALFILTFTVIIMLFVFVFLKAESAEKNSGEKITGNAVFAVPSQGFKSIPSITVAEQFVKFNIEIKDDMVYKTAYVSINSSPWIPVNLTGGKKYGVWVALNGTGIANISSTKIKPGTSTNNYVAVYSCKRMYSRWDCHGGWQLRKITITKSEATPLPDEPNGPGDPSETECTANATSTCYDGDVYWYNSCNERGLRKQDCTATQNCTNGVCIDLVPGCPQLMPPSPDWCTNGVVVQGALDEFGCRGPPTCNQQNISIISIGKVVAVWASDYESNSVNYPSKTLDGNLSRDSRWSSFGDGQWIAYALNQTTNVSYIRISFYSLEDRTGFDIQYSTDNITWRNTSAVGITGLSGEGNFQRFNFNPVSARYIRIFGHGRTDSLWNSLVEVDINGFPIGLLNSNPPITCTAVASNECYNGDVYWYDACRVRGARVQDCNSSQTCANGACVNPACVQNVSSACSNGDVYWYDSCSVRGVRRFDCNSSQTCSNGVCVNPACVQNVSSACSNGDVYWYDSCSVRGVRRFDCNSSQNCTNTGCVNNAANVPVNTRGLIADHNAAMNFEKIPDYWINEAKKLTLHYAHTSHGSQIISGANYVEARINSKYNIDVREGTTQGLPSTTGALRIYDGNPPETYITPERYWSSAAGISSTKSVAATGNYDYSMWSWCGQQSSNTVATVNTYLAQMKRFESEYPDMRFILMTGHTESGSEATTTRNNNLVREYATANNMILFDFEDIEKYDPDGRYYSGADDSCVWCTSWCNSNPTKCQNLPSCAHSHGALCIQKGKAFWWMMARLAGWDGVSQS